MLSFKQYITEKFTRHTRGADFHSDDGITYEVLYDIDDIEVDVVFALDHGLTPETYEVNYTVDGVLDKTTSHLLMRPVKAADPHTGAKIMFSVLNLCMDFIEMFDKEVECSFTPANRDNLRQYEFLDKNQHIIHKFGFEIVHMSEFMETRILRKIKQ